ncbi:hypothetical protein DTO013E5_6817 [Penicillium roqueforti]|uniref:Vacuolar membrane protein n=1 Tax=Penicillium roqueforti (strain FM164) TaxID=1365484 RepID=W6QHU3_PENRF|nr:uncharacterized protein LCP9604111_8229 [Penicillium roqueforti]XP_057037775.1 uncharacterized protein N7518_009192 [Penicillium psychrosexuale]CDM36368.1 Protein of unknown function DUF3661, vaculolar transmembrane [Penicillium roqueforti FM164]KAF9241956.1 hypothetical protein LCP9604111_8229 [Penicillium roqueforti]KAI1829585.1 hypothetical protein CBS147337_9592 [Penicillium roqueforti]KAI2679826.1 hypothetical protein CBS147355_4308 [Penicillium roqueforti]KAI2684259.1 hypothetical pr
MDGTTGSLASIATTTLIAASSLAIPTPSGAHTLYYDATNSSSPGQDPNGEGGECKLLGPFSVFVQIALGSLALLSLVYKRWRERPQRPVKIWAFDVSKQVFGSVMLHMLNLVMSLFSAGQLEIRSSYKPNPCSFYLLNLGIDTTLGIPILILLLHVLNRLASYTPLANPPESIESGNYGQPPRITWWLKQAIVYFMGLLGMKICVFFLIELLPFIVTIGDWALRWTEGHAAVQIFFVMLLFPVIMNAIQYYIIDIFIKKPVSQYVVDDTVGDFTIDDDAHRREALLAGQDESDSADSDDEEAGKSPRTTSQPKATADALQGERLLPEDDNPVPPYEPPSSSGSGEERYLKASSTQH